MHIVSFISYHIVWYVYYLQLLSKCSRISCIVNIDGKSIESHGLENETDLSLSFVERCRVVLLMILVQ